MRNPLVLPKITKLAGHGAGLQISPQRGSEMSVKPSKGHHRTLVISARPWFYFLLNIGLNPDVFFVVNRRSDSVAFGNEIMPAITFLSIIDHACLQCLLGHLDSGTFSSCSMLTAEVTLKISILFRNSSSVSISTKPSDLSVGQSFSLCNSSPPVSTHPVLST